MFLMQPLSLHKHREEVLWILKIFPDKPTDAILLRYSSKTGESLLWRGLAKIMGIYSQVNTIKFNSKRVAEMDDEA